MSTSVLQGYPRQIWDPDVEISAYIFRIPFIYLLVI